MTLSLIFTLAEEVYGLEVDAIQEIIEDSALQYVPRAGGVLSGAINFHGQILAVIDLPELLGFSSKKRDPRKVVLTPRFKSLVLQVSSIQGIVTLDATELQQPVTADKQAAIRGVVSHDKIMVNLLDTDKVINKLESVYEK